MYKFWNDELDLDSDSTFDFFFVGDGTRDEGEWLLLFLLEYVCI